LAGEGEACIALKVFCETEVGYLVIGSVWLVSAYSEGFLPLELLPMLTCVLLA
jgi:hypothetical protein